MGLLDRKKLLQKEQVEIKKVDLGNNDFVYVRQMSAKSRDLFERSLFEYVDEKDEKGEDTLGIKRNMENFRVKLVLNTICDEKGKLLLRPEDMDEFSENISANTLDKIVEASQKLNAISEEAKEELLKNSETGRPEDSSSGSAGS